MEIQWNRVTWYSRIFSIIIFTALPFWGFYLGYNYGQTQISGPIIVTIGPVRNAAAKQSGIPASGWFPYRNDQYGFTLKYPLGVEQQMPTEGQLVKLSIPGIFEIGTNFAEASFVVSARRDPSAISRCETFSGSNLGPGGETSTVVVEGITFYDTKSADAGAGNFYQTDDLRTLRNGACYDIIMTIHSTNIDNYPQEFGVQPFNYNKIRDLLFAILQTFSFAPTPQ